MPSKLSFPKWDHSTHPSGEYESNVETVVNPLGEEHDGHVIPTMGLYVQCENCTHLVALGKISEGWNVVDRKSVV